MGKRLVGCDPLLRVDRGTLLEKVSELRHLRCIKLIYTDCLSQLVEDRLRWDLWNWDLRRVQGIEHV